MASATYNHPHHISGYLEGSLLVATGQVNGSIFDKSVIYICIHNVQGAMGVIVNQKVENVQFSDLFNHLKIDAPVGANPSLPIHFGGPVDATHGFVLHSGEYENGQQLIQHSAYSLTSNAAILKDIAKGSGPRERMLVLGYAGWEAGQIEREIESGSWLTVPATPELIFDADNDSKWLRATSSLGFDPSRLSPVVGHA